MDTRIAWIGLLVASACAAPGVGGGDDVAAASDAAPATDSATFVPNDASDASSVDAPASASAGIYANTFTELYRFDPIQKTLSLVAPFTGCNDWLGTPTVWDIAIDSSGTCYATTTIGLWKVDLTTAVCTKIAGGTVGSYPPSENMSFVPKGTIDPTADTLIGYASGSSQPPSTPEPQWHSTYATVATAPYGVTYSGLIDLADVNDVVSVQGGGTFAVGYNSQYVDCMATSLSANCLLQIDPTTGARVQAYGIILPATLVEGLAYWAGVIYTFGGDGNVSAIEWKGTTMTVTDLPVSPANLHFMGAASTTAAPVTTPDGGAPPIN